MRSSALSVAAVLLSALHLVKCQTYTSCNPLSSNSCPPDPALGTTLTTDFTQGASSDWTIVNGQMSYGANGAEFVINAAGDAPTISSEKYLFFGQVTVTMRACPGSGMVSSFILQSDDLDEIDWEWLGSNDASVESNFFGKGNTTTYNRAVYHPITDPTGTWHTYTIDWTSSYIKWYIDSNLVRTLPYNDPLALGGQNFPQTPMRVRMGNWVGCASQAATTNPATEGTCQWAGGVADFSQAPFTMYVKTVTIQDYGCGTEYTYGDESGSWQSIQTSGGCSDQGEGSGGGGGGGVSSSTPVSSSTSSSVQSSTSSSNVVQSSTTTATTSSSTTSSSSTSSSTTSTSLSSTSSSSTFSSTSTTSNSTTTVTVTPTSTGSRSGSSSTTNSITSSEVLAKSTSSSTSSSKAAQTSVSDATELKPKYKYGALEFAILALGLGVGI